MRNSSGQHAARRRPSPQEQAAAEIELRYRRARLVAWADDPVLYARERLGIECWARQAEVLYAVARRLNGKNTRTAVRSGHKVGKSTSAIILALWFVETKDRARVIMTSSSGRQVHAVLWKEMWRVYTHAPQRLPGILYKVPDKGLQLPGDREVVGFSTDKPEKMAGFSSPNIFYIIDEASGVDEAIFEAIEGNRAAGADVVMFSNPTQTSGTFFDAFHAKKKLWHPIKISSEESPNVVEDRVVIPGMAGRAWVEEKKEEWGEDSPIYGVRVKGEFPTSGVNNVVPLGLVTRAQERGKDLAWDIEQGHAEDDGVLCFGVDPARFGDDESCIAPKRGKRILPILAFQGLDGVQLAARVVEAIRQLRRPGDPLPRVKVDSIGIGASCCDQLRYHRGPDGEQELLLIEVNSSETATDPLCRGLRTQLWFGTRQFLLEGGTLPDDDKLVSDLAAPTYSFDPQARYIVESKADTKARLGRSPDRADAANLANYEGGAPVLIPAPEPPDDDARWHDEGRGF